MERTPAELPGAVVLFEDDRRVTSGSRDEIRSAVSQIVLERPNALIRTFDLASGREIDVDPRELKPATPPLVAPAKRGRPALGVVPREVTLLPRHWEWLSRQPGGASVTLRRLVDQARKTSFDEVEHRTRRDAAYQFMVATGGNAPFFEEASRALFADDRGKLCSLISQWPDDIRAQIIEFLGPEQDSVSPP